MFALIYPSPAPFVHVILSNVEIFIRIGSEEKFSPSYINSPQKGFRFFKLEQYNVCIVIQVEKPDLSIVYTLYIEYFIIAKPVKAEYWIAPACEFFYYSIFK